MACRLSEIVIDCTDAERLAEFWCEVLGWAVIDREDGAVEIGPADVGFGGPQPTLFFSPTDTPKLQKLRWHIDVNATDRDQADELQRLLAIGAKSVDVGQPADATWHVLADPEGNEFCLLRRRLDPV
jgi:catechol 2,3-dioxygenase-like lactoylglutathione lyase family enzyme